MNHNNLIVSDGFSIYQIQKIIIEKFKCEISIVNEIQDKFINFYATIGGENIYFSIMNGLGSFKHISVNKKDFHFLKIIANTIGGYLIDTYYNFDDSIYIKSLNFHEENLNENYLKYIARKFGFTNYYQMVKFLKNHKQLIK